MRVEEALYLTQFSLAIVLASFGRVKGYNHSHGYGLTKDPLPSAVDAYKSARALLNHPNWKSRLLEAP